MENKNELRDAAEALLAEIELHPGGYDYRPYYVFRPKGQLNDPDGAVIRLKKAVESAGGKAARDWR
jgi:hypothetical protein